MTLPSDIAQLSAQSISALRSLIGFSLVGRVTKPHLALKPRGQFTSEGVYQVTWQDFLIEPKKTRFSKGQHMPEPVRCHVEQTEIDGILVNRLDVQPFSPENSLDVGSAGHAVGAVAMFPLSEVQVLSSPVQFPLADVYDAAPPIVADIGIRFIAISPAGNRGGFSLMVRPNMAGLYFVGEDASPKASLPEVDQRRGTWDVRMTLA